MNRKFAVIGHPIGHSMSPFLNERLFALSHMPSIYETIDIKPAALRDSIVSLRQLDGFNITIPYKQAIIPLLDGLDEKAAQFGSVNTVKNQNGRLIGYTTDGAGFHFALARAGISLTALYGPILILGCGGASRAISYELATHCPSPDITLVTRESSMEKAETLRRDLSHTLEALGKPFQISVAAFNGLENKLKSNYTLAVNGTSLGMFPETACSPVSSMVIRRCHTVFDAVYNPHDTIFLQTAQKAGCITVHGMDMLVGQAAASHKIWDNAHYQDNDIARLCADAVAHMEKLFRREEKRHE